MRELVGCQKHNQLCRFRTSIKVCKGESCSADSWWGGRQHGLLYLLCKCKLLTGDFPREGGSKVEGLPSLPDLTPAFPSSSGLKTSAYLRLCRALKPQTLLRSVPRVQDARCSNDWSCGALKESPALTQLHIPSVAENEGWMQSLYAFLLCGACVSFVFSLTLWYARMPGVIVIQPKGQIT